MPLAGKYRLIDIPISNCLNSGLNRMYILTQFLSVSLHRHVGNTYKFDMFDKGFVELLAAQQTYTSEDWYQGTADAIRQNMRYWNDPAYQQILVLSGDQLYRMDFRLLLKTHAESRADITMAVLAVPRSAVSGLGVLKIDNTGRIIGFAEKPTNEAEVALYETPGAWLASRGVGRERPFLANMGIYVFNRKTLKDLLEATPPATDFGKDVFPRAIHSHHVQAHVFDGYWEDLGTIKSYHEASLALTREDPQFELYSEDAMIFTRPRNLPPSRVGQATLNHVLIADGAVVLGGTVLERSIVGIRGRVGRGVTLRDTVFVGGDRTETDAEREFNSKNGIVSLGIGDGCVIETAIIDKDCRIGKNVRMEAANRPQEKVNELYEIHDGIVVVPRGTTIPDGMVI